MITPTEKQLDALKELINIGVGKAASMLNELINAHIVLQVPLLKIFSLYDLDKEFGDMVNQPLSAVHLKFKGSFSGTSSLVFPPESAIKLLELLTGSEEIGEDFDNLKTGTLMEVGNILLNGVMGSLSNILGKSIEYTIPAYIEGDIHNLLDSSNINGDMTVLLVRTRFHVETHDIMGDIILLFEVVAFNNLLKTLDQILES